MFKFLKVHLFLNHNTSLPTMARTTKRPIKNRRCIATTTVNFSHESKSPPQPPLQKGGSLFGISSGRVSSFTVKKSGAFSPPFLKGGGGICFSSHTQTPTKKPPLRFHKDGSFSQSKRTRRSNTD
jgi:hypothetical protein